MSLDFEKYGISESALDLRWRFLISCLKCEYDNYGWVVLESQTYEFYEDTEEGREAYEDHPGLPIEGAFKKVSSWILYEDNFGGNGGYEILNDFPEKLHELRDFLEGNYDSYTSDGEDGLIGFENTHYYPESPEAFEINSENSASLLEALDELDLSDDFWSSAAVAMRETLQKNL